MPKFAQATFNEDFFGLDTKPKTFRKTSIAGIPLGLEVRKQIRKEVIFRIRRGNGYYGSIDGHRYQDEYAYFVPSTITDPAGDASRSCFANAVLAWQALTSAAKGVYNRLAQHYQYMSGYNLYIRGYMNQNYP